MSRRGRRVVFRDRRLQTPLARAPLLGIAYVITWILTASIFRYSSLAALVATFSTPFYSYFFVQNSQYIISGELNGTEDGLVSGAPQVLCENRMRQGRYFVHRAAACPEARQRHGYRKAIMGLGGVHEVDLGEEQIFTNSTYIADKRFQANRKVIS